MPVYLGSISFSAGLQSIGLISGLLSLDVFRHHLPFQFALGTNTKLLHHSYVSSMPSVTITCCLYSLFSSSSGAPAKHMLPFLGATDTANCLL